MFPPNIYKKKKIVGKWIDSKKLLFQGTMINYKRYNNFQTYY